MNREIRPAVAAGDRTFLTGSAASRAMNHIGIVPFGTLDRDDRPAAAAKAQSDPATGGVVLQFAGWTGNEQAHSITGEL
jgi:hypothetical protein